MAWPQVGECQKIVEKLISAKVRIMPASAASQRAPEAGFAPARRRLRLITMSAVTETKNALHEAEHEKVERQAMPQADDEHVQHDA